MRRLPLLLLSAALACTSEVAPQNPYDPATPPSLQAKARVTGTVETGASAPFAGLDVYLRENGQLVRSFTTDPAGAFVFDALTPGSYSVEVQAPGFAPVSVPLVLAAGADVDVGALSLAPLGGASTGSLRGSALLGRMAAAPGAPVEPDPAADNGGILIEAVDTPYAAVTTSTGDYELALPPGLHTLRISHPNFVAQTLADLPVTLGVVSPVVVVVLATNPAKVSGQVVAERPDGSVGPIADALVTLDGTSATGLTSAAGQFTLDQLAPGSYLLRVVKDGYATASVPVLDLAGGEARLLADPLSLALQRGGLRGVVALADTPGDASGVVVEVTGSGRAVVTGADGAFAFDGLVAGTYEVRARREGYAQQVTGGLAVSAGAVADVPLMTLTRQGGTLAVEPAVTTARQVTLVLGAPAAASFRASEDPTFQDPALGDTTGTHPYRGMGSSEPFTLSDRDGAHQVYVVFLDAGGGASAPVSASTVLDRLAPSSPSVVIGSGAPFASGTAVELTLSAQDLPAVAGAAVSGLARMELADNSAFTGSVTLAYNRTAPWVLSGGDGLKAVYARFYDQAGNPSAPAVALVNLDTQPPQAPAIALSGGAGAPAGTTGSPLVTAALSATDANEGPAKQALQVRLSNASGFAGATWQPFAASVSWLLPPGDGDKTVYAQFMDPAGNQSLPVQANIHLAGTAPTAGSLSVAGGAAATNARVVPVALSASGAAEMRLYVDGVAATGWIPYATSTTVDLGASPDEASRTVSVSFRNSAGVEGAAASDTIVLDQRAPTAPGVVVNGGAAFAASTGVTLALSASDGPVAGPVASGLATVEVANDASFTGSATYPMTGTLSWTLASGPDGPRTVYARFRDQAGNVSAAASAAIVLDTAGPGGPAITLAGNPEAQAGYTGSAVVTATLSATDVNEGVGKQNLQVRLSGDPGFAGASWQPYAAAIPWVLPLGDGAKTVWAQFRDAAGNQSLPVSAAITLDATPPTGGAIAVAGGAAATNQATVTATTSAVGAAQMQLYVNGVAQGGWIPYAGSASVTLGAAPDESTRTVSVVYRGPGGLDGAAAITSIVYDTRAPLSPTLSVNGGAAWVAGTGATLSLSASDGPTVGAVASGLDTVELANNAAFTGSSTVPYATSLPWTLPAGDGSKTVYARFRDRAGNVSATVSATTVLDTLAPASASIALAGNAAAQAGYTGTPVVTATLSASDANEGAGKGNLQVRLSNDPGFAGAAWQPYAASLPWVLPIGDGAKTVYAQFRDAAGNASLVVNASIQLLEAPPSGGSIALAGGAPATNQQSVLATIGAANAWKMQVYVNGVAQPGGWVAYGTATAVDLGLSPDESTRTVSVVFRSLGGVDGGDALTTIVMDRTAPVSPALAVNGGAAYAGGTGVTLTASASDGPQAGAVASGLASVEVANNAAFTGAVTFPYATTVPWTLPAGDGAKTVYARFRDKAGNTSAPASAGITLDTLPPTSPSIALAGNPEASAGYSGTPVVTATLSATDLNEGAGKQNLQVRVSNDVGFSGASWQPYTTGLQWVLTAGDGTKTVYAQFRDAAGNQSATTSASIQLLTTPPTGGSILLAGGADATSNQVVPVTLSASNAATMRLSVNGAPVTGWIAYATSTTVDVGALPDQATRVVSVSFRNLGGVEGGAATASIRLDKTPPGPGALTVVGTLGNGTSSTALSATPAVVLQITPPGGDEVLMAVAQAASTAVACSTAFATPAWQPVSLSATLVLTGVDGPKRACVLFRDAAGNFSAANARGADLTLDTTPPSNPTFVNLVSRTQNAPSAPAAGVPVVTASTDATAGGVVYQCTGGTGTRYGTSWVDCGSSTSLPFAYALAANAQSTLGVRARDAAYNYSPGSFVQILHDDVAPFPPFITEIRSSRDSVTVTWDASGDTDVVDFLVHYGSAAGALTGTGAAQGPSPVSVGSVTGQLTQSFTLTGLTPGLPYYVAIEAVDAAGNRSGPGGERSAVPAKANPRVLSTIAGEPRAVAMRTASGTKTFMYLAENQGVVQFDMSSDAASTPVGRAFLPDLVPDDAGSLPVFDCTRGGTAGHCVVVTGTTAEGDYRGNHGGYRAPAHVVFFGLTGTAAAPTVGTIEAVLPARPLRAQVATIAGEPVVFTFDAAGLQAFGFKAGKLAFLRQLVSDDPGWAFTAFHAVEVNGTTLWAFASSPDWSAPFLFSYDVSNVLAGLVTYSEYGNLLDNVGGSVGDSGAPFAVDLKGGVYAAYTDAASHQVAVSRYPAGGVAPSATLVLPTDTSNNGTQAIGLTAGLAGHHYVFASSGMDSPRVLEVLDSGAFTFLSNTVQQGDWVAAVAGANHLGAERLYVLEGAPGARGGERFSVSGAVVSHLASGDFSELTPDAFTEADRLLYVANGRSIRIAETANPFSPQVVRTSTPGWVSAYWKTLVHGRFLYALSTQNGMDIYRINGDASLTWRTWVNMDVRAISVVGRWLFLAMGTTLYAYNAAGVGAGTAPTLITSLNVPGFTFAALDARYRNSTAGLAQGGAGAPVPQAVVYAVSGSELRTYGFDGVTLTALGGPAAVPTFGADSITVRGDYAMVGTPAGSYRATVSSPSFPSFATTLYPVSGASLLQYGYVVGLGPAGDPNGPSFDTFSSNAVDGSIRFSVCAASGLGGASSLTHVDGRYAASCGQNGVTLFTPVALEGGRLLRSVDVSATWNTATVAPLAGDGMYNRFGGPTVPCSGCTDSSRLYHVSEQTTADAAFGTPTTAAGNALGYYPPNQAFLADNLRYPAFMSLVDGALFVVTGRSFSSPTVDAYDVGTSPWTYIGRYSFAGTQQPAAVATDGEYLYVARNGVGQVDVLDVRNPVAITLRATIPASGGLDIASLALARDRLYVGMRGSSIARVYDVSALQSTGVITAKTSVSLWWNGDVTGLAVVGGTLFATQSALGDPTAPYKLYTVALGAADRDGSGASVLAVDGRMTPMQSPVVAGDVLYLASNLGTAAYDLGDYWRTRSAPVLTGGANLADPFAQTPVALRLEGPFAALVGGVYRVFDLR